jgi:recombination endonuclease VII
MATSILPQMKRHLKRESKQQPKRAWNFPCGHSGVLPDALGQSNDFAYWKVIKRTARQGSWACRYCKNTGAQKLRQGLGQNGIVGKLKNLLRSGKVNARRKHYTAPQITPDELVALWISQEGKCAACGCHIELLSVRGCALDHNHWTGEVRGFLCHSCNWAEGLLKDYSEEQFQRFCEYRRRYQSDDSSCGQ